VRPHHLTASPQPFQLNEEADLGDGGPPELPGFHDDAWMAVSNTVEDSGAEEDEDTLRGQDGLYREDVLGKPLHDKKVRV